MNGREVRAEAREAAAWWAAKLGNAIHDIGDRDPDERQRTAAANLTTAMAGHTFTDDQRSAFRRALEGGLEEHLRHYESGIWEGTWDPECPQRGSGIRYIACGYGPDPVLADAAKRAGLRVSRLDFPMKTVMWVNPGQVKVSEGYGAPVIVIWQESAVAQVSAPGM